MENCAKRNGNHQAAIETTVIYMGQIASNSTFSFKAYASDRRVLIEKRLEQYMSANEPEKLWESMRYSVLSGGKRLRALLCLAAAEAILPNEDVADLVLPCACAIEMVHAMSLIHDDLPSMDNDDLRRGKPTNHKVFGEAMALLAGDALLMLANEILIEETPAKVDRNILLSVVKELSIATGAHGMVGGQVEDMNFTGAFEQGHTNKEFVDEKILSSIHRRKTGALITFSIWSGARLAGANERQLIDLKRFGEILGLAFQITDDLLDVTGDASTLGKTPGKDEATQKATWVRLFGIEGSKQRLQELESEGLEILRSNNIESGSAPALTELLKYAIHRVN
ncbi:MAG: farnesyl diphosphate synthase [Candidatus Obscuribacterales bacterium]|nr:polyprenyl synthetase family protein [Cyanobacteria bacterium SZAS LIN-5]